MLKEQRYITWHSKSGGERGSAEYDDPSISAPLLNNLKQSAANYAGFNYWDAAFISYSFVIC